MKKNYIAPSMKVREIDMESLMAANSPTAGFTENPDGTISQPVDPSNPGKSVGGGGALSNYNVWSLDEDEE